MSCLLVFHRPQSAVRLTLLFLLTLTATTLRAQDAHFSQYLSVPTYLNPAFAGYDGCSRIMATYRNQWPQIGGNYQSVQASYDQYVRPMRGGIAVNFEYDNAAGVLSTYAANAIYSPVFRLFKGEVVISPALQLGWRHRAIRWDKLTFGEMIDPRYRFIYQPMETEGKDGNHVLDIGTGVLLSHHGLVYGAAFHHVTQPNEGFGAGSLPLKSTAHITYHGQVTPNFAISPSFIFINQQDFHQFLHALSFQLYGAKLGAGFRHHLSSYDSVIMMAGYAHRWFSIGYSFDLTVSSLGMDTGGSHEVNLAFRFNCKNKEQWRKGPRLVAF